MKAVQRGCFQVKEEDLSFSEHQKGLQNMSELGDTTILNHLVKISISILWRGTFVERIRRSTSALLEILDLESCRL